VTEVLCHAWIESSFDILPPIAEWNTLFIRFMFFHIKTEKKTLYCSGVLQVGDFKLRTRGLSRFFAEASAKIF
jgi:hypothetical protein